MLEPFRTITVEMNVNGKTVPIEVPFTVELLTRVEETIQKTTGRTWFRLTKSDKSIIEAFDWFAEPYLTDIDLSQVQPTFTGLFFSHVRNELVNSINAFERLMTSTEESNEPTEEKNLQEEPQSE